jgi:CRISPR-associated endoribonuclease Cas6
MPLQVTYVLDKGVLPVDYRRGFASLLKEAIKQANPVCYERFYSRVHVLKPFTLSVFFPGLKGHENNHFTVGSKAILYFATSSTEICTAVCNGILYKRKFPLFENTALLQNVFLKPRIMITQKKMMFKTMSPVLVNTKGNPDWYLLPGDEGFREGLGVAVREVCRAFLDLPEGKGGKGRI